MIVNEYISKLSTYYSYVWHFKGYIGNVVGGNLIFKFSSIVFDQAEETQTSLLILIGRELQCNDQTVQIMFLSALLLLRYQINLFFFKHYCYYAVWNRKTGMFKK